MAEKYDGDKVFDPEQFVGRFVEFRSGAKGIFIKRYQTEDYAALILEDKHRRMCCKIIHPNDGDWSEPWRASRGYSMFDVEGVDLHEHVLVSDIDSMIRMGNRYLVIKDLLETNFRDLSKYDKIPNPGEK